MASKGEYPEFVDFGRQGGKIRAKRMTPEERSASARAAAQARWKGHDAKRPAASRKKKSR